MYTITHTILPVLRIQKKYAHRSYNEQEKLLIIFITMIIMKSLTQTFLFVSRTKFTYSKKSLQHIPRFKSTESFRLKNE